MSRRPQVKAMLDCYMIPGTEIMAPVGQIHTDSAFRLSVELSALHVNQRIIDFMFDNGGNHAQLYVPTPAGDTGHFR